MKWREFTVWFPEGFRESITGMLFDAGCIGTQDEDGLVRAYFDESVPVQGVVDSLSGIQGVTFEVSDMDDQDWYASWKEQFGPMRASGLLICPPWNVVDPAPGEKLLMLDPGQAFGAGDHVTTMMVLGMLHDWAQGRDGLAEARLLDLGTGTGILAIAAHMYGVGDVTAVDNVVPAIETAGRNLSLNGLVGSIKMLPGSIGEAGKGYDIILANIFQEVLLDLMPDMVAALKPGGVVIVSGLLEGQEDAVFAAAEKAGLRLASKKSDCGWVSASLGPLVAKQ
ncbi:MAG: 50S ribosomal protein L11 methyltransferase [Nitrospirae bacterium]|nr:50S ribosomal protein L11 methyltransferase [Nitrospirota bacterium]MBI5695704.1 50S ribosomal protein L11 methyltransferase [Nitrospirota bacterium]